MRENVSGFRSMKTYPRVPVTPGNRLGQLRYWARALAWLICPVQCPKTDTYLVQVKGRELSNFISALLWIGWGELSVSLCVPHWLDCGVIVDPTHLHQTNVPERYWVYPAKLS